MIVQLFDNQPKGLSEPITVGALIAAGGWVVDNWDTVNKLLNFFPYNPKAPGEAARIAAVRKRFIDNNLMPYQENGQIVSPRIGAANFLQLNLSQLKRYANQIKTFEIQQFSDPAKYNPNNPGQVPRRVISRHQLVIASILAAVEKRIKELASAGPVNGARSDGARSESVNFILPAALVAAAFAL